MLRIHYLRALPLLAAMVLGLLFLVPGFAAQAQGNADSTVTPQSTGATITVDSTADTADDNDGCTLRKAITNANNNDQTDFTDCAPGSSANSDTIIFKQGLSGTITLDPTLGSLIVADPAGLTIDGGQEEITVGGDDKIQVFVLPSESEGAKLAVENLTVADGFADDQSNPDGVGDRGGGIVNDGGTLTVTGSTFSGNNALFIGGGIANLNGGTLEVTNSTFSGNRAFAGGAIVNSGTLAVTNSTFSNNGAEEVGGGIENANIATAKATLSNTILANNANGNIHNACVQGSCQGTITDGGYNISDDTSFEFTKPTSKSDTETKLDPLGLSDNGGPTQTIALQTTSPAVNAIPPSVNGCGTTITTDQRGVTRPQGPACDIGAFELAQTSPPPPNKDKKKHHKKKHKKHHKKKHHNNKGGGGGGIGQGSSQG